jgi:hypothetical protein
MKEKSIHVVPANPRFYTVYRSDNGKEAWIGEPIIAWRIESNINESNNETMSTCYPLTSDGDPASNCIGVQNPDKSVNIFEEKRYKSLEEFLDELDPSRLEIKF